MGATLVLSGGLTATDPVIVVAVKGPRSDLDGGWAPGNVTAPVLGWAPRQTREAAPMGTSSTGTLALEVPFIACSPYVNFA